MKIWIIIVAFFVCIILVTLVFFVGIPVGIPDVNDDDEPPADTQTDDGGILPEYPYHYGIYLAETNLWMYDGTLYGNFPNDPVMRVYSYREDTTVAQVWTWDLLEVFSHYDVEYWVDVTVSIRSYSISWESDRISGDMVDDGTRYHNEFESGKWYFWENTTYSMTSSLMAEYNGNTVVLASQMSFVEVKA